MKKIFYLFVFNCLCLLLMSSAKAYNYDADLLGFNNKLYLSDGSYLYMEHSPTSTGLQYTLYKYNPNTGSKTYLIRKTFQAWQEGVNVDKDTIRNGQRISNTGYVLIFDEEGRYSAYYSSGARRSYVNYSEGGKLLRYQNDNTLFEAFNNMFESELHAYLRNSYSEAAALNDIAEDGNYYEKDSQGNITGIYYQDGTVKNYKYDGGGNIISSYDKNGISTYKRTSYTPAEAAAAIKKGNNNKITFTFK